LSVPVSRTGQFVLMTRYRFRSTFALPSPLGDLLAFLLQSPANFMTLGQMSDANKVMNPQHFGIDPADIQIRICKSGFEFEISFYDVRHIGGGLHSLSTL